MSGGGAEAGSERVCCPLSLSDALEFGSGAASRPVKSVAERSQHVGEKPERSQSPASSPGGSQVQQDGLPPSPCPQWRLRDAITTAGHVISGWFVRPRSTTQEESSGKQGSSYRRKSPVVLLFPKCVFWAVDTCPLETPAVWFHLLLFLLCCSASLLVRMGLPRGLSPLRPLAADSCMGGSAQVSQEPGTPRSPGGELCLSQELIDTRIQRARGRILTLLANIMFAAQHLLTHPLVTSTEFPFLFYY